MKVNLESQPFERYPYWVIPQGGERVADGRRKAQREFLEIWKGTFEADLPEVDAIIATSDLQGIVMEEDTAFLLGERLPEFLLELIEIEFPQVQPDRTGVLLCGDLFALSDKRGGLGDVKNVWRQFKYHFKWVAGVAGNHDTFGSSKELIEFRHEKGLHLLSRETQKVNKIEIGGISGIIGDTDKPNRIEEADFLRILKQLLLKRPDMILLHQGPDFPDKNLEGEPVIRATLESSPPNLILCGHRHWETPLVQLSNQTQVLNVDKRVVILLNAVGRVSVSDNKTK